MYEILLDAYKTNDPNSGLGQFSLQLSSALVKHQPENLNYYFLGKANKNIGQFKPNVSPSLYRRFFPALNKKYDLWHSYYQFPSFLPPKNTPWLITIHDLNFLKEKSVAKGQRYLSKLQNYVNRCSAISTISEFSKKEILEHLDIDGKKVHVIYNGVRRHSPELECPNPIKFKMPFFFTIGILSKKKNFETLLPMMKLYENHKLVIAGRNNTPYGAYLKSKVRDLKLEDRVLFLGEISDAEKNWCYANSSAFLFPSYAEGFGIPPIEAMQFGKPVILNNSTSLPEVGGNVAGYFDGFDPKAMKSVVDQTVEKFNIDATLVDQSKDRASHFTWEKSVHAYLALYNEILQK